MANQYKRYDEDFKKTIVNLYESARNQMEVLRNNKNVKELEVLQQQVNEDNKYLIESK